MIYEMVTSADLLKINVNEHTEKKNGLTYLSWAWAWAEVLKIDPKATWSPDTFGEEGRPAIFLPDGSAMVGVMVTINGHKKGCLLPVMNYKNQAIKNPDAFAVNTAIMRCLAKAIAMHGLGLYIYAGEDLPENDGSDGSKPDPAPKWRGTAAQVAASVSGGIADERKHALEDMALTMINAFASGNGDAAQEVWDGVKVDHDEGLYLWGLLGAESKLRAFLKSKKSDS